jgi:hypothetical protein
MRLERVLLVGGLWTAALLSGAVSTASALTNADKIKIVETVRKRPPIAFFVVKGVPDACGRGCDSWIAAEGTIDADSAARLRLLLEKLGKLKLPIYFNSQGGLLSQGLAIGRMLRKRGMTAGVARTLAAGCLPTKTPDECANLIRAQPESEAVLRTDNARCLSACALAFIGATNREVAPDALLGVHSTFVYFAHLPRGVTQSQLDRATDRNVQRLEKMFSGYVAEMKLGKDLFNVIWKTKFEDMHYLTRAELYGFGIDRREPVETGWHFGYQPVPPVGSAAFVNLRDKEDSAAADQKRMTLMVSCDSRLSGGFLLTTLRRLPNPSARPAADLRISAGAFDGTLTFGSSFLTTYNGETFEVRQQRTTRTRVDALITATAISVSERPTTSGSGDANEASTVQFSIPGTAAGDALKTLVAHCAPIQAAVIAVAAPPSVNNAFSNVGEAREPAWRFAFLPVAAIGSAAYANAPWTSHPMVLAISCVGRNSYTISTVRRLPDSSTRPNSDILLGDESPGISLPATASSIKTWKGDPYDVRQSRLSNSAVEKLLASATITVREKPTTVAANPEPIKASETKPAQYSIPTKGAPEAFKALGDHCAMLN